MGLNCSSNRRKDLAAGKAMPSAVPAWALNEFHDTSKLVKLLHLDNTLVIGAMSDTCARNTVRKHTPRQPDTTTTTAHLVA